MVDSGFYKTTDIKKDYKLEDKIGEGSFAEVRRAIRKSNHEIVAIKIIKKDTLETDDLMNLESEIQIMKNVDHPNIVKMIEFYDNPGYFYMVLEQMTGGELFDRIMDKDHYTEQEASEVIKPIVDAIKYCHKLDVVHRDLKPENILYATQEENSIVKVSDFGLAKIVSDNILITACGTPSYMAPEILHGKGYDKQVDFWSIGVILYILLCGYPPFYNEDSNAELFKQIKNGDVQFPAEDWDQVSEQAKDLIRKLLNIDPTKRFDADKILKHPWMNGEATSTNQLDRVTDKIKQYSVNSKSIKLKQASKRHNLV